MTTIYGTITRTQPNTGWVNVQADGTLVVREYFWDDQGNVYPTIDYADVPGNYDTAGRLATDIAALQAQVDAST